MIVYLSSAWQLKPIVLSLRKDLQQRGVAVQANWLDFKPGEPPFPESVLREGALMDLHDIDCSDIMVLINPADWADKGTGGRHVETGYALHAKKPTVLMGERTNVFHHHPGVLAVVPYFAPPDELVAVLHKVWSWTPKHRE